MTKELISLVAIIITFIAFIPYIASIVKGQTRPHAFSWIIWAMVTFVVFLAQLADRGGAGAWPTGFSGIITLVVALLAYLKRTDHMISRSDWLFFVSALMALPLWAITQNPLSAVVILTTVDLLGFIPTFRKAWFYPQEEALLFYNLIALRNGLSILALEHYSVTTVLFPAATGLACLLFTSMVVVSRKIISRN